MNVIEKLNSIKSGEMTAKENVEGFIKVIDETNDEINAFLELNYENALKQAEAIDEKIANGEDVGALAGLVFGIKANINVEDMIISAASKTLEDYYGSYNATVVDEILAEDGIIIGILNMDEFAAGSSTETSYYGPTQNPAAMGRIPGGSSGGCAAAIAGEMCDISIGSDTGGSIRNPASHCGVVGFKPTYGAVSRQGLLDLSMSLDQIGPLANDVSGIALALNTIAKYDKTFKPISLYIDGQEVDIVGQIDRVDKCGDEVFIVDYKTYKSADIDLTELYYGTQIQLMLYLRTIEQNTSGTTNIFINLMNAVPPI